MSTLTSWSTGDLRAQLRAAAARADKLDPFTQRARRRAALAQLDALTSEAMRRGLVVAA